MEKETFKAIDQYKSISTELYFELEKLGIDTDKLEELYEKFDNLHDELLQLGEYEDKEKLANKAGYLNKDCNGFPKHLKLSIIYEYENGYSLCQSTSGLIGLFPQELITYDE